MTETTVTFLGLISGMIIFAIMLKTGIADKIVDWFMR